jgi:hypothetical protein
MAIKEYLKKLNDMPRSEFIKKVKILGVVGVATTLIPQKVWANVWFRDDDGTMYSLNQIANQETSPAGSDTQIQFNDNGSFGASSKLTYNPSTNILKIDGGGLVNSVLHINGATDSYIRSTATDLLQLGHSGSPRVTIDGSGNVGIGTSSPDELFHLEATAQSGTREVHMKASTSDAGNDQFGVTSGTSTNNNFAPTFFGYKDSAYNANPNDYIYSMNLRGLIPTSDDTANNLDFGILNFETYSIPDGDASDPNNAASLNKVNNRRLLSFRNGADYILTLDPDNTLTLGDSTTQGKIITGGFTNQSAAFDVALGMKYDTSLITGLGFENGNASGQVRFMAESNDGNYTSLNAPGTSVTGSWLGVNRNTAHFLWTNAGRHLAIGTLSSGYDLILGAGDAQAITIDGSNQRVSFNKSTALSNVDIYADDGGLTISGRGDDSTNDVVMKIEDASGTYTGYWGINDGFGNMSIGINIDEDGKSVGYGSGSSGPAKIVFGGHGADGHVSLNAMKETADGSAIEYDIGLLLDSSDNTLRIGGTSDMGSSGAGLLNGDGKKIADVGGNLYGTTLNSVDGKIQVAQEDGSSADRFTTSSGAIESFITYSQNASEGAKVGLWVADAVTGGTLSADDRVYGINAFAYLEGSTDASATPTDTYYNAVGGRYGSRVLDTAQAHTISGISAVNEHRGSGAVTNSTHFLSESDVMVVDSGNTITNLHHFRVLDPSVDGTITNQYGLYIDDLEGASNNYAVYTAGDTPSIFGGAITADSIIKSGATSDDILLGDGTTTSLAGVVTDPAGSDTQLQFNDNGSFGASSKLTYNPSTNTFKVGDTNVMTRFLVEGEPYAVPYDMSPVFNFDPDSGSIEIGVQCIATTSSNYLPAVAIGGSIQDFYGEPGSTVANGSGAITISGYSVGSSAISIGSASYANGADTLALGKWSVADGNASTAIGNFAYVDGEYSTSIGGATGTKADGSVTIGNYDGGSYKNGFENLKDDTILFGFKRSNTQHRMLEVELNKGVRVGATSGESITMDGDDLYVVDEIEAGGNLTIGGDGVFTGALSASNLSGTNTGDQDLSGKQDVLVSGTNIKTINSTSLLGSGDISISASPAGSDGDLQINNSGVFGTIAGLTLDKTGNARGTNALDIQSKRTSATQVPSGTNNFCIGLQNTASNYNSGCVGYNNTVGGWYGFAVAVGSNNTASGYSGCTSVGSNNNNTANSGICVGASNIATYYGTTAVGRGNRATNAYSSAVGAASWATGYGTVAFGNNVRVSGAFSNAFGNNITNTTSSCTEIGPSNSAKIRISSSGFDLTVSSLPFLPASIADSSAPNNSVYYSTTQSKLVYKDSGGTVNTLY